MIKIINKIGLDHAPLKLIKEKKSQHKPWITSGIRKSIENKNSLYKKFLKAKSATKKQQLNQYFKKKRNLVLKIIRQSKTNYYREYFDDHKQNLKLIWKGIRNVIGVGVKKVVFQKF